MMSSKDDFFDSAVTQVSKKFEHGISTEKVGNIYVENEPDVFLWEKLLGAAICKKYDFSLANSPISQDIGTRGKCRFRQAFKLANKNSIFAVDADFDVLAPTEEFQQIIVENDYIFHTVAYSRENLLNSCGNLEAYLTKFKYGETVHQINIKEVINELSITLYLPFLYSLYIKSTLKNTEIMQQFNKLYENYAECIFDEDKKSEFIDLCENFLKGNAGDCEHENFQEFINDTKDKGLNKELTYLFLCGKNLERLIDKISEKIKNRIITAYIEDFSERIRKEDDVKRKLISDKRSEVRNYLKNSANLSTLREHLFDPSRFELYRVIEKQFQIIM